MIPLAGLTGTLGSVFLRPLGLAALAAAVPVVLLYLLRPDPSRLPFPAVEFLLEERERSRSHPALRRLVRSALLLIQLLAIAALAVSLAAPYVPVAEERTVSETVLVVDGSASMATHVAGTTRFDRAVSAAKGEASGETSVVVAGSEASVAARRVPAAEARAALDGLQVTDAPGDLRRAVERATAVAGTDARIVVLSDFADGNPRTAVAAARARGHAVSLRQFDGGGADNVGVIERTFADGNVSVRVRNFGDGEATRRVSLGGESRTVRLGPGDVARAVLPVPAGGGRLRLSPGDSFHADDEVAVAAPSDPTVDVLVLTNDVDRELVAALSVVRGADVTVKRPPASVTNDYDVVVFGDVEPGRLLAGTRQVARETLASSGGVVIRAQPNLSAVDFGGLLPFAPNGTATDPAIRQPEPGPLTEDVTFPAPGTYVTGDLRSGRPVLETTNGTALLALAPAGSGRVLYYGYPPSDAAFEHNYRYPVFWKRVVHELTGRRSPAEMNRRTGDRVRIDAGTAGEESGTVTLDRVGFHDAGGRRYGTALANLEESDVTAAPVDAGAAGGSGAAGSDEETRTVPFELTALAAGLAAAIVIGELGFLRRRGDL